MEDFINNIKEKVLKEYPTDEGMRMITVINELKANRTQTIH
jgi:hypothetical protein